MSERRSWGKKERERERFSRLNKMRTGKIMHKREQKRKREQKGHKQRVWEQHTGKGKGKEKIRRTDMNGDWSCDKTAY